ncbi:hypothetical protein ABLG96_17320 [Nakamurella sp. A5-74]|uniref:Lipoprotein n=1 Tax=Nakamurella sp. A5-74 TaxID=3158264 RepID=A0AAU8DLU1_9ACTN
MSLISTVRARAATLALVVGTVVLTGCSTTPGVSAATTTTPTSGDDGSCTSVVIRMRSGSVPDPYNYRWELTLDGEQGAINAEGSAQGATPWKRSFVADADSRAALCVYAAELAQQGPTDGVGGSTVQAEYTPEGGSRVVGPEGVDGSDVPERMTPALPAGEWAALKDQLDAWSNGERMTAPPTS